MPPSAAPPATGGAAPPASAVSSETVASAAAAVCAAAVSAAPAGASAPAGGAASGGGMHSATACPRRTRSPARSKSSRMCSRPAASTPSRRAVSATASPRKPGRLASSYKFSQASTAGPPTTGWYTVNSSRGTASGHSRPPSAVTVHWTGAAAPSVVISQILPPGNVVTRGRLAPAAPLVPLQAQLDQTVDQFRVRQAGGFPQLGEHADVREAGHGVDLIHPDGLRLLVHEKVHAGQPAPVHRLKRGHGHAAHLLRGGLADAGGNNQLGLTRHVFGFVIVKVARGHDFARNGPLGAVVAQNAAFHFAALRRRPLHDDFAVVAQRLLHRRVQPLRRRDAADADAGPQIGRLDETRIAQLVADALAQPRGVLGPLRVGENDVIQH